MGLIEHDSSKEFATIAPQLRVTNTRSRGERDADRTLTNSSIAQIPRTYKQPKPFESTSRPHRRTGLNDIHSSQFTTTRSSR